MKARRTEPGGRSKLSPCQWSTGWPLSGASTEFEAGRRESQRRVADFLRRPRPDPRAERGRHQLRPQANAERRLFRAQTRRRSRRFHRPARDRPRPRKRRSGRPARPAESQSCIVRDGQRLERRPRNNAISKPSSGRSVPRTPRSSKATWRMTRQDRLMRISRRELPRQGIGPLGDVAGAEQHHIIARRGDFADQARQIVGAWQGDRLAMAMRLDRRDQSVLVDPLRSGASPAG